MDPLAQIIWPVVRGAAGLETSMVIELFGRTLVMWIRGAILERHAEIKGEIGT